MYIFIYLYVYVHEYIYTCTYIYVPDSAIGICSPRAGSDCAGTGTADMIESSCLCVCVFVFGVCVCVWKNEREGARARESVCMRGVRLRWHRHLGHE